MIVVFKKSHHSIESHMYYAISFSFKVKKQKTIETLVLSTFFRMQYIIFDDVNVEVSLLYVHAFITLTFIKIVALEPTIAPIFTIFTGYNTFLLFWRWAEIVIKSAVNPASFIVNKFPKLYFLLIYIYKHV